MKKLSPKAPTWTAIALVVMGLFTIFLAWNGAAGIPLTQAQVPYLISGGLTGLCLVGAGLVLLRIFEARRDSVALIARLERLQRAVEDLAGPRVDGVPVDAVGVVPGSGTAPQETASTAASAHVPPYATGQEASVAPVGAAGDVGSHGISAPPPPAPPGVLGAVPPFPAGNDDATLVSFEPEPEVSTNGTAARDVMLGSASYHDLDCRMVAGRSDLERAPLAEAARRDLSPCRVCNPAEVAS